jgi:hypothetical protein
MLANTTYKGEIDYVPFQEYDSLDNTCWWKDFMSGDWAWQQAVHIWCISYNSGHTNIYQDELLKDLNTHGSVFVPIILGSDKTTVSVGMGNNEYYPLYALIINVHNNVWHAHHDALGIIGFLSIPKSMCINVQIMFFIWSIAQLQGNMLTMIHFIYFTASFSLLAICNSFHPETCNGWVRGLALCRQSFSTHYIWRTLYNWLWGATGAILYHQKLVPEWYSMHSRAYRLLHMWKHRLKYIVAWI